MKREDVAIPEISRAVSPDRHVAAARLPAMIALSSLGQSERYTRVQ